MTTVRQALADSEGPGAGEEPVSLLPQLAAPGAPWLRQPRSDLCLCVCRAELWGCEPSPLGGGAPPRGVCPRRWVSKGPKRT